MPDHIFDNKMQDYLQLEMSRVATEIADGAMTFEEYKFHAGIVEGLRRASGASTSIKKEIFGEK